MTELQQAHHTINYLLNLLDTWSKSIIKTDAGADKLIETIQQIIYTERRKLDPDPKPIEHYSHESEAREYVRMNQAQLRRNQGYE